MSALSATGNRRGARLRDRVLALAVCLIVMRVPVWSQTPARRPPARKPTGTAAKAAPGPAPDSSYRFNPAGRRDPFVSLLGMGDTTPKPGKGTEGLAGLTVDAVVIKGVLQSGQHYVAMVEGPNGKTYLARVNDRLADGKITSITLREVVIEQNINNPLSLVKRRVIRKPVGEPTK